MQIQLQLGDYVTQPRGYRGGAVIGHPGAAHQRQFTYIARPPFCRRDLPEQVSCGWRFLPSIDPTF
jgi:hypothetical protein